MKWFRNDNTERLETSTIEVTDLQNQFQLHRGKLSVVGINADNCSYGPIYRDPFTLVIHNFTSDKNGYYWCQIFVNHSVSQPLQYAWFYAADNSTCVQLLQQPYFEILRNPQYAEFYLDTNQIHTTTPEEVVISTTLKETSHPTMIVFGMSTGPGAESKMDYLFYVIRFLVFLLLAIAILTIVLLLYCFKSTRKITKVVSIQY